MNPDLPNPASGTAQSVSAVASITRPMPNTTMDEAVYFHCTLATASFHRQDGKKLPFLSHFLKCTVKEDIEYLDYEIRMGNPYVRRATEQEVDQAKMVEDPVGSVREAVKKELSIEDLEKLLAERRAAKPVVDLDAVKIAGADKRPAANATTAVGVVNHAAATGANTATLAALLKGK